MQKAVFLDRDGVINWEPGHYTTSVNDFIINEGIAESVKLLNDNGFIVIVISNQGGIAKGLYTEQDVLEMHEKLCKYLSRYDAKIDDLYFCPHHQDYSKCLCRKPENLLFEKAISKYSISRENATMIGDSDRDIEAAKRSGVKGVKVSPNANIFEICNTIVKENNG